MSGLLSLQFLCKFNEELEGIRVFHRDNAHRFIDRDSREDFLNGHFKLFAIQTLQDLRESIDAVRYMARRQASSDFAVDPILQGLSTGSFQRLCSFFPEQSVKTLVDSRLSDAVDLVLAAVIEPEGDPCHHS